MPRHHGGKVGENARKLRAKSTPRNARKKAGEKLNDHKKRYH